MDDRPAVGCRGRPGPTRSASRSRPPCPGRAAPPSRAARARSGRGSGRRRRRGRGRSPSNVKPGAGRSGRAVDVDDRVAQAAGRADDRRRAVAQGDHLAGAARLEARRHEEAVGAGVDPPREVAIEALDERDPVRPPRDAATVAKRADELAAARRRGRRAGSRARASAGAARGEEVEALLADRAGRSSRGPAAGPPDRARARSSSVGAAAPCPTRFSRASSVAGERAIRRRIPEVGVEAVEDPEEAVAPGPQRAVEAHPVLRRRAPRAAKPGLTVLTSSAPLDAGPQEVEPVGAASAASPGPSPSSRHVDRRRPAVVGEVVDGQHDRRPPIAGSVAERRRAGAAPAPACQSWMWMHVRRPRPRPRAARARRGRTARTATRCRDSRRSASPYSPSRSKAGGWSTRRSR